MNPSHCHLLSSRRHFFEQTGAGFAWLALCALLRQQSLANTPAASKPRKPHHPPKAKRVLFLLMQGGPSHLDTFDYKPQTDQPEFTPSPFEFKASGKSGLMISSVFPKLAEHADDLCILNGMHTSSGEHYAAQVAFFTGDEGSRSPALGAWSYYGLGSENEELPGFISIGGAGGTRGNSSAYLPSRYQGVPIHSREGLPFLRPRQPEVVQKSQIQLLQSMGARLQKEDPGNTEIEAATRSFQQGFAMQTSVPNLLDIREVDEKTKELYGQSEFGRECLLASRLAQKGVRFIQLSHRDWDHHSELEKGLRSSAAGVDGPIAALITDLKNHDLLKDTLIVWGGEFGRSPRMVDKGRDHNNQGFSMWMAGGGVKGGMRYGATDEIGRVAVDGRMSIRDLHATILYALGLDMAELTEPWLESDARLRLHKGEAAKVLFT